MANKKGTSAVNETYLAGLAVSGMKYKNCAMWLSAHCIYGKSILRMPIMWMPRP